MENEYRENYGSVFLAGLVICIVLAVIVYAIG